MGKKKEEIYSINKELWEKSRKPTSTVAMGMKQNVASALCWKAQVDREQQTALAWEMKYDPEHKKDKFALAALDHTIDRERRRREDYSDPSRNPELYTILYRQNLDNATSRFKHQQKTSQGGQGEASDTSGGKEAGSNLGPVSSAFASPSSYETTSRAAATSAARLPPMFRTQSYLTARCDHYTPQERYGGAREPPTAAMVVGWTNKDSLLTRSNTDLYKPVRPNVMGPYRNPEDGDHALLFGYDLQPK